jgi:DNA-binding PadR family transcriptional regulator
LPRTSLGEFEHQVLLAVLRLGKDAYSVSVVEELEGSTDRSVSQAAVFIAMQRLESRGLLVSRFEQPAGDARHVRRYFRVTPAGVEQLREFRRALKRLWRGMERRLDEG